MKKVIIIFSVLFCSLFYFGCDNSNDVEVIDLSKKYNAKFEQTGDSYDYVFVNPEWELVNDNYSDENGNTGELYVNINNPIEKFFSIRTQSKAYYTYYGVWNTREIYDKLTRTTVSLQSCDQTTVNQNCYVIIIFDDKGDVISTIVNSLPRVPVRE